MHFVTYPISLPIMAMVHYASWWDLSFSSYPLYFPSKARFCPYSVFESSLLPSRISRGRKLAPSHQHLPLPELFQPFFFFFFLMRQRQNKDYIQISSCIYENWLPYRPGLVDATLLTGMQWFCPGFVHREIKHFTEILSFWFVTCWNMHIMNTK